MNEAGELPSPALCCYLIADQMWNSRTFSPVSGEI